MPTDETAAGAAPTSKEATDYGQLQARFVRDTAARLRDRIDQRLHGRNLVQVADEVCRQVENAAAHQDDWHTGYRRLRIGSTVLAAAIAAVALLTLVLAVRDAVRTGGSFGPLQWLPVIEAGLQDVVFAGVAIYFLYALPRRRERDRILPQLHKLRSLAHIIDMHQLTKDPETLGRGWQPTQASATHELDRHQMTSYLNYCSELLSLVAKTAALFAEHSTDQLVLASISEIENLTNGMSRKIWQKISLLPPQEM